MESSMQESQIDLQKREQVAVKDSVIKEASAVIKEYRKEELDLVELQGQRYR